VFGGAEVAPGKILGVDEEALNLWLSIGASKDRVIPVPALKKTSGPWATPAPAARAAKFTTTWARSLRSSHTDCKFGCECGRYVEIWNLVFIAIQPRLRISATSRAIVSRPIWSPCRSPRLTLARASNVWQPSSKARSLTMTRPIHASYPSAEKVCSSTLTTRPDLAASFRIIADHSRAATFLISDGVVPSNEGRGYLLRKIIRRALRHSRILGAPSPFLSIMSDSVRALMAGAYPELGETAGRVNQILDQEEMRFSRTVNIGLKKLEEDINELRGPILTEHFAREQLRGTTFVVGRYPGEKLSGYTIPLGCLETLSRMWFVTQTSLLIGMASRRPCKNSARRHVHPGKADTKM